MYLRRCEGDDGAFGLVVLLWKFESAAGFLPPRRPGYSNVIVAVSLFAPPDAAVGVVRRGCLVV